MNVSPGSSLVSSPPSEPDSDPFAGYPTHNNDSADEYQRDELHVRPSKRQRTNNGYYRGASASIEDDTLSTISSDTEGDVPQSPGNLGNGRPADDDLHEQVTTCKWEDCQDPHHDNMDRLVEHINNEHVEGKHKKYVCEWMDCSRKGKLHASGYALKAHMRGHTREKPFYCALPECDKSFTRSDALAKHMRTTHDTEPLRPSDPVPRSMQPVLKNGVRSKLGAKDLQELRNGDSQSPGATANLDGPNPVSTAEDSTAGMLPDETSLSLEELFNLRRRQLHWLEEESDKLQRECETVEAIQKREWMEKELLLEQVISIEVDYHERRKAVLASLSSSIPAAEDLQVQAKGEPETDIKTRDETTEEPKQDQQEAAAVLASLSRV